MEHGGCIPSLIPSPTHVDYFVMNQRLLIGTQNKTEKLIQLISLQLMAPDRTRYTSGLSAVQMQQFNGRLRHRQS